MTSRVAGASGLAYSFAVFPQGQSPHDGPVVGPIDATTTWRIEFHSNGFLHKMIRNLIGTIIDIARGQTHDSRLQEPLEVWPERLVFLHRLTRSDWADGHIEFSGAHCPGFRGAV